MLFRSSWCIAQYLGQWDSYVGGENVFNKQYSILNFNLPPSDNKSIIGITIAPKQQVRACHLKNDANASSSFQNIFNDFEKSLGLEKGFIWSGLVPMSDKEIEIFYNGNRINPEDLKQHAVKAVPPPGWVDYLKASD